VRRPLITARVALGKRISMPTPATAKWPQPKSEDEWEDMVLDAMRLRWRDPNAQRNGRRGQRQNGVDVFGCIGSSTVGAQAKNSDQITEAEVRAEILKAEKFKPVLMEFHFAIAGRRDAKFQEFIRLLSQERIAEGVFPIVVHFFDDICEELASRPELVQKYWGQFMAITGLLDALPNALLGPVLDPDAALARVYALPQFKTLADYIRTASSGKRGVAIRFEGTPLLDAPRGSIERSWQLVVAENQEHRHHTLWRVAIDLDSGNLSFYSVVADRWLSREEWLQKNDPFG
jgi:hypothetical protein